MVMLRLSNAGFTLVMVLLFLHLASLLALYELLHVSQTLRLAHATDNENQRIYMAKNMLNKIATEFKLANPPCEISLSSMHYIGRAKKEWWQDRGCVKTLENVKYYFVYERLDSDSCGYINNIDNNQIFAVIYYRITLFVDELIQTSKSALILQATLAKSDHERLSCSNVGLLHEVYPGLQMTRVLTSLRNMTWH